MRFRMSFVLAGALATLSATIAAQPRASTAAYRYQAPSALDDGWKTGALDDAGINSRRIEEMTDSIRSHPKQTTSCCPCQTRKR